MKSILILFTLLLSTSTSAGTLVGGQEEKTEMITNRIRLVTYTDKFEDTHLWSRIRIGSEELAESKKLKYKTFKVDIVLDISCATQKFRKLYQFIGANKTSVSIAETESGFNLTRELKFRVVGPVVNKYRAMRTTIPLNKINTKKYPHWGLTGVASHSSAMQSLTGIVLNPMYTDRTLRLRYFETKNNSLEDHVRDVSFKLTGIKKALDKALNFCAPYKVRGTQPEVFADDNAEEEF